MIFYPNAIKKPRKPCRDRTAGSTVNFMSGLMGRRIYSALAVAVLTSSAMIGLPSFALAQTVYSVRAGVQSTGPSQGVYGYIRGSATVPVQGTVHRLDYVNLCTSNDCTSWVQVGELQGVISGSGYEVDSPDSETMYIESMNPCGYFLRSLGAPPAADYPYYITYNGASTMTCDGATLYSYALRVGSITAPAYHLYTESPDGIPMAIEELAWESGATEPPSNNDYFGCDTQLAANASYGLRIYNAGSGALWTTANDPNVFSGAEPTMTISVKEPLWAFSTT